MAIVLAVLLVLGFIVGKVRARRDTYDNFIRRCNGSEECLSVLQAHFPECFDRAKTFAGYDQAVLVGCLNGQAGKPLFQVLSLSGQLHEAMQHRPVFQETVSGHDDTAPASSAILQIESEPPGAQLRIEDTDYGETPYFGDNRFPPRVIHVQLRLRGYRTWRGTFRGGAAAKLSAKLIRN